MRRENEHYIKHDPIFNSYLVNNFINRFMRNGKREKVEHTVYLCFRKSKVCLFFEIVFANNPLYYCSKRSSRKKISFIPTPLMSRDRSFRIGLYFLVKCIKNQKISICKNVLKEKILLELNNFSNKDEEYGYDVLYGYRFKDSFDLDKKVLENRSSIRYKRMILKLKSRLFKVK